MVINSHLFSRVFDRAALALSDLSRCPIQLLTEADLQSHLFKALHEELRDELDSNQLGLHCQPRFFPSSVDRSGKRYPDLCILDRRYYFLASRNVSSKGFQIHGPSIQVEIKLRRLNYRGEQLAYWTNDLEKLARWRDSWHGAIILRSRPRMANSIHLSLCLVICQSMSPASGMFCDNLLKN